MAAEDTTDRKSRKTLTEPLRARRSGALVVAVMLTAIPLAVIGCGGSSAPTNSTNTTTSGQTTTGQQTGLAASAILARAIAQAVHGAGQKNAVIEEELKAGETSAVEGQRFDSIASNYDAAAGEVESAGVAAEHAGGLEGSTSTIALGVLTQLKEIAARYQAMASAATLQKIETFERDEHAVATLKANVSREVAKLAKSSG